MTPPSSPPRPTPAKRNPGKNLSSADKESLLKLIDEFHPTKKQKATARSTQKGEKGPPSVATLYSKSKLKQDASLSGTCEPVFEYAAFFLVRDGWLDDDETETMKQLNPYYEAMTTTVPLLKQVNFSDLAEPRLDYEDQEEIDHQRAIKLTACAVHYGLDLGRVVRFLGHEYTGDYRDVDAVKAALADHISSSDLNHILRMLTKGAPSKLQYELPHKHKMRMIRRGNQPSVLENMTEVRHTMNKEEKHSHLAPFFSWVCVFSPSAQHVPQGMVIKLGKSPRIVWDGSS